ncbi:response regulator transcription factor [Pseudonocardia sp. HH130630-07]|uniref:response regulator transcription factor n=1 Tax=Pseudonocardia sp. HH130630-07 TaxID=1690815 RepID=UPI00081537B7|nr:response regulator transcription factor [Pseudonocardia sp. HH130630-07]ANY06172.1 hypothetical protein AFB00_07515 [Pseudonocardia sp. HH130630-07]
MPGALLAEAAGRREAVEPASAHWPDAAVLDVRMPGTGVRAVAAGGAYLSPRMTRRLLELHPPRPPSSVPRPAVDALTGRERTVLGLLGRGLSNAEIGRELHLVEGTVEAHVSAILDRLGVRNRVQAAIAAHEHGLVR